LTKTLPKLNLEHQNLIKDMYAAKMKAHHERCVAIENLALAVGLTEKNLTAFVKSLLLLSLELAVRHSLTLQQSHSHKRPRMTMPEGDGQANEKWLLAFETATTFLATTVL
jgi:hypothetical protein